jgi:phosphocarrier protein
LDTAHPCGEPFFVDTEIIRNFVEYYYLGDDSMIRQPVVVTSELGIHARPSSLIAQTAMGFRSQFNIIQGDKTVDGKSILGVMSLAAEFGASLTLEADGPDEKQLIEAMLRHFANKFADAYKKGPIISSAR